MKLKRIAALVLAVMLVLTCSACSKVVFVVHVGEGTVQNPATNTTPEVQQTQAPVQEQTTAALIQGEATTAAPAEQTTAAPAPSGAPQGTAAIISYYNTAANKIKTSASSVTRNYEDYQHNEEKLKLPSLLQNAGKGLISSFLKRNDTPQTYEGADVASFYLPGESYVSKLTEAQVKSAECKDNGSEYEITIVANTEKNPTYGQGLSGGFEIIKTEDVMNAAGFIVKSFDTEYYDCTIKCKVDKSTGNITWINFSTPIVMDVASSIGIDATVGMTFVKDYTVSY